MSEQAIELLIEIRDELNKPKVKFLTRKDVMKMLKYSEATVTSLFRRKDFPAITIGRRHVVEESALLEWCKEKRD